MQRLLSLPLCFAGLFAAGLAARQEPQPAPELVLGEGDERYAWVDGWPRLPEGQDLGYTHGCLAVDAAGRIYVETNGKGGILVFEPDGAFVRAIGAGLEDGLHGMCLVREGEEEFLYVTHLQGRVLKLTLAGEILWELGYPKESGKYEDGKRFHPTGVAVAKNGDIYVADGYGRHWIHRYDRHRKYLESFGGLGNGPGQFKNCHGLRIEEIFGREVLVVADRENQRVQILSLGGKPLRVWSEGVGRPCNVSARGERHAVADIENGRVLILDAKGGVVAVLGAQPDPNKRDREDLPRAEQERGRFHSPHDVVWDAGGDLYVVDWLKEGRVTKLRHLR